MTGTLINVVAILLGGGLGVVLGDRFPEKVQKTVMSGLGLFCLLLGAMNFLDSENVLLVLFALLSGMLLGEWWKIEEGLEWIGSKLQKIFVKNSSAASTAQFIEGFVVASLLFCVGPMAIMGSIQDGLTGDFTTLFVKSIMDAFAAMAFASTMGIGVLFSAAAVFVYQGTLTLLAGQAQTFITDAMMAELNAVGGVLLAGIAVSSLLSLRKIRMGSFLPALFLAPLFAWIVTLFE